MQLVWPAAAYLTSYVDALKQGWSPNNVPALTLLLDDVRRERLGLTYVELTTEPENVASRRVITANVGQLVEEFVGRRSMVGRPVFDTASTWTRSGVGSRMRAGYGGIGSPLRPAIMPFDILREEKRKRPETSDSADRST